MSKFIERNIEQQPIPYKDVMDLGANRGQMDDNTFFDQHGYDDFYVELSLTKKIYIDWNVETQFCSMKRCDAKPDKGGNIKTIYPIKDLEELKQIVEFYKD